MPNLEALGALKTETISKLKDLANLAQEAGLRSLRDDLSHVRIPKLEEERFILVILGEFNHGKTTFVNALLGRELLPTGITPTTATLHHIVYADPPYARVIYQGGDSQDIALPQLTNYTSGHAPSDMERISYIEVGYPSELLRERVTLVDTPGVNDLNTQRAEITHKNGWVFVHCPELDVSNQGETLQEAQAGLQETLFLYLSDD